MANPPKNHKYLFGAKKRIIPRIQQGQRGRTEFIVIHDTESDNIDGVESWFENGSPQEAGAHIGISRFGETRQWALLDQLVYHAVGANSESIGIEVCGYASFSPTRWLVRRNQRIATAKAVARLCYHFSLGEPKSGYTVKAHADFPQGGHNDPGIGYLGSPRYHGRQWRAMMTLSKKYYRKWYA